MREAGLFDAEMGDCFSVPMDEASTMRLLLVMGATGWSVGFAIYLALVRTMTRENYGEATRNWPEGE
jgi:hypothetical protein